MVGRTENPLIKIRRWPWPYDAALAICSDPDTTAMPDEYAAFHSHLNVLPWRSSAWDWKVRVSDGLFLKSRRWSSFLTEGNGLPYAVESLIRDGTVDTIHSFAELDERAPRSEHMIAAARALADQGIRPAIWTNHSASPFNLLTGHGDSKNSPWWHSHTLKEMGVRFIWVGALTPAIGQETPLMMRKLWNDLRLSYATHNGVARSWIKHGIKVVLARGAACKYRMLPDNNLIRPVRLRDGTRFWEFVRWGPGDGRLDRFRHLNILLGKPILNRIIQNKGATVLYTHFGKKDPNADYSKSEDVAAIFSPLVNASDRIWVCGTADLLSYCVVRRYLDWSFDEKYRIVKINGVADPVEEYRPVTSKDIMGLTFISDLDGVEFEMGVDFNRYVARNEKHFIHVLMS